MAEKPPIEIEHLPHATNPSLLTVQQHVMREQRRFPNATGEFSWLFSGLTLATKMIAARVRRAGLSDILGSAGEVNVQGEVQQKLDVFANDTLIESLSWKETIGLIASEENDRLTALHYGSPGAKYAVVFDPLDGSSNIDVNVSVGTIFSILRCPDGGAHDPAQWVLQPGRKQVAAGYVLYGSSTMLVYTSGNGVHGFTLDPSIGAYLLSHENIKMPEKGSYYSVNEAYRDSFPAQYQEYLDTLRRGGLGKKYALRYIGSLVADFHRTLLRGGVFLYPPTADAPGGKLRLMYEANPIAFLAEQAGGQATDGKQPILDIVPQAIHERTPLVVGSRAELELFKKMKGK
jgi:fructose-1,6-bisphosphatase I